MQPLPKKEKKKSPGETNRQNVLSEAKEISNVVILFLPFLFLSNMFL